MIDRLSIVLELPLPEATVDDSATLFFYARLNTLDLPAALSSKQSLMDLPIHYKGLKDSAAHSGLHPIFVCTCGYLFCDSLYVDVSVDSSTVTWREYFRPDQAGEPTLKISASSYKFERANYEKAVQSIEEAVSLYIGRFGKDKVLEPGNAKYTDLVT